MNGLIVIGTTLGGGFIGGMVGMMAAMMWADMEISSSEGPMLIISGTVVGAAIGAFVGGQIVAG